MMTVTEASRETPLLCEMDVMVVGGGAAGIGAALSAGRNGAKTILIERFGFLGGCQTLTYNDSYSFIDDHIQGGLIQEIIDRLERGGAIHDAVPAAYRGKWSDKEGCFYFDGEYYKFLLDSMMEEAGVKLLYHAFAVDTIKENNFIKGVIVETHQGRLAILAKSVIDCTGIADLTWKSGISCLGEPGEEGFPDRYNNFKGQHMGYGYGYFLSGLDYDKFRKFAEENEQDWDNWVRGRKLFSQAKENGMVHSLRTSIILNEYPDGRVWMLSPGYTLPKGQHPWMAETLTAGEIDLRKQAWSIYQLMKNNVPGFENTKIEQTPSRLMFRDGHRIHGEYVLTEEDIRSGKTFDDAITLCNMPPDLFFPDGSHHFKFDVPPYDIPYRSLLSKDYNNLLAAGGVVSCDFITWAAVRYCTPSVCTGQAAGLAAALAAKQNISPKQVDIKVLQDTLNKQGMMTTNKNLPREVIEEYKRRAKEWGDGFRM
ncbi:MAG: FAD-dependent oxidoreductase [Christensenellales bacterium]|jgi:hypothetical protein